MSASRVLAIASITFLLAANAAAQEPLPPRPEEAEPEDSLGETYVGMRVGYSTPLGNVRSSGNEGKVALSELVALAFPVWIDAEYAPLPELVLGLSFVYGVASPADAAPLEAGAPLPDPAQTRGCLEGSTCRSSLIRPGGHVLFHPWPASRIDPWIGAGVAYEWFLYKQTLENGTKNKLHYHGPELINAQLGVDVRLSDRTWLGGFGSFHVGRFVECGLKIDKRAGSCNIVDRTQHEWATIGLHLRTHFWTIRRASALGDAP